MIEVKYCDRIITANGVNIKTDLVLVTKYHQNGEVDSIKLSSAEALHLAEELVKCFNDRSHEGSGLTGNQQLPVDLSSIGRLKATCPIFEDGHGDHGY